MTRGNSQKNNRVIQLGWLALVVVSIVYLVNALNVVSDISQFMPDNHDNPDVQLLLDELQQGRTARLLVMRLEGNVANTKMLASLSKQVKSALEKNKLISQVYNGEQSFNIKEQLDGEYKTLFKYRYLLAETAGFKAEDISTALQQRLREFRAGISLYKETLANDPQNHFANYLFKLKDRSNNSYLHGVWFDQDKKSALLVIELALKSFNLDQQQQALDDIKANVNQLITGKNIHFEISGAASLAVATRSAIQSTTQWLSTIALVLMSLLFWWSYRSARLFLIAMVPLASAVIAALSITNLVFEQVHGIIIAFGITLLGVCIDYPVHLFSHHSSSQDPKQTILSIWPTLRLGVITTAFAYLAMIGTGFSGLSQLAIFAVTGLAVSLLVTRWIIPDWLNFNFVQKKHRYLDVLSGMTFSSQSRLVSGIAVIAFAAISIALHYHTSLSKDISDLSPIPENAKQLDQQLRSAVGAPDVNHVFIIKDYDAENVLQQTEVMVKTLNVLKNENQVKHIFSVSQFIPSQQTQLTYQKQLPSKAELQDNIKQATESLPFKKDFFAPFISDVTESKTIRPLSADDFLKTPLSKYIEQDFFYRNNQWVSVIRLSGVANEQALKQWLDSHTAIKSHYLNLRQATSSLMSDYQKTALMRFVLGAAFIAMILIFVRPFMRMWSIFLPVVLAVLLSVGILLMMGTQLNLFHILALLLIIGIGLDYSLFFDRGWESSNDYQQRLHGIFISASSTLITFGILGFSDIPVLSALGQTVTYGVLGSFVLTLIFNIKQPVKD